MEGEEDSVSESGSLNDSQVVTADNTMKNTTDTGSKSLAGKISVKAKIGDRSTSSNETMPTLESLEPETNG